MHRCLGEEREREAEVLLGLELELEATAIESRGWERQRPQRGCVHIWSAWWGCVVATTCGEKHGRAASPVRVCRSRSALAQRAGRGGPVGNIVLSQSPRGPVGRPVCGYEKKSNKCVRQNTREGGTLERWGGTDLMDLQKQARTSEE